jgi:hypothetical protein
MAGLLGRHYSYLSLPVEMSSMGKRLGQRLKFHSQTSGVCSVAPVTETNLIVILLFSPQSHLESVLAVLRGVLEVWLLSQVYDLTEG